MKMPTIIGIFIDCSREVRAQLSWARKKFYNLAASCTYIQSPESTGMKYDTEKKIVKFAWKGMFSTNLP